MIDRVTSHFALRFSHSQTEIMLVLARGFAVRIKHRELLKGMALIPDGLVHASY